MAAPSQTDRYSKWFILIVSFFITCLITSNIIAVKLINLFGSILPAGVIIFPLSYIIGDVLTEVYGYGRTRQVIWLGFICNLITIVAIWLAQLMPPAAIWDGQAAYEKILGYTPRLLIASFLAYLVGEFTNSLVLAKMKIATRGRWLWTRTIGSTLVGQGLDSVVFITIAFVGTIPFDNIVFVIITQWMVKWIYEVSVTPLTYLVVTFLKRQEGIDYYDNDTNFSPLRLLD